MSGDESSIDETLDVVERSAAFAREAALERGDVPGVYVISDGEYFKIGRADKSIRERLRALQCGNPRELEIVCIASLNPNDERSIHIKLRDFHVRGEWFRHCEEAANIVIEIWVSNGSPGPGAQ